MPRYSVSVALGTWTVEVEADDPETAIMAAIAELAPEAGERLCAGTFEARELADEG